MTNRKKAKIGITMSPETLAWVDDQVKKDYHYADRSHLIEIAINDFRAKLEKGAPGP